MSFYLVDRCCGTDIDCRQAKKIQSLKDTGNNWPKALKL